MTKPGAISRPYRTCSAQEQRLRQRYKPRKTDCKKPKPMTQLLEAKQKGRYSSPEVIKFEANAEQARAAYRAAQELIKNTNIRAPFPGTVYQIPVKQGSFVPGGELLVQVANLEHLQVRAFVDEPEIGRLSKGEEVAVTWDATPGRTWQGELTRVPTVVTMVGTRTVGEITRAD